jgi:hypothetical protein
MSDSLFVVGIAIILALQATLVMGGAWLSLGRWFTGRDQARAALAVSLAFWAGVYLILSNEAKAFDLKMLATAAVHFGVTLALFKVELRRAKFSAGALDG